MWAQKETTTTRDVVARRDRPGQKFTIPAGARLQVTQSLEGSYTVMVPMGYLARIDSRDADAIGEGGAEADGQGHGGEAGRGPLLGPGSAPATTRRSGEHRGPPGLVYRVQLTPLPEGGNKVEVNSRSPLQAAAWGRPARGHPPEAAHGPRYPRGGRPSPLRPARAGA